MGGECKEFPWYTPLPVNKHRTLVVSVAGVVLFATLLALGHKDLAWASAIATLTLLCVTASLSLNLQIGLAALLGVTAGLFPESGVEEVRIVGRIFVSMLKMMIVPMILFSITAGIAEMGSVGQLQRIGSRTLGLYMLTMAFAVATGLLLVNLVEPGADGTLRSTEFFASHAGTGSASIPGDLALGPFLSRTIFQVLNNPFASLAEGRILPVVVFAILLGIGLVQAGDTARPVLDLVRAGYAVVMRIIGWILRLTPVGIFALLAHLVASVGLDTLVKNLLSFSLVVIGGTLVHAAVTLPAFAYFLAGVRPGELFRGLRDALLVAFSTSSSVATLPVTTRCVEENLGVRRSVSSFVLPLGATVNMDGTALYEAIAALFIAHVYGIELSLSAQAVVFFVSMLMATGAPGIPSAGMVTMIVVLESVGLPAEAIGLLIPIDRLLDTIRTMTNVEGDAVVALIVSRQTPEG